MKYIARAPLRLGLAGGGTDVSPYCDLYGGNVLNATIDRYAYSQIKILKEKKYIFHSLDRDIRYEFVFDKITIPNSNKLILHEAVLSFFKKNYKQIDDIGIELTTFCDAPIGSGLGSSSTIVVTMIRAFVEMLNLPFDDYAIANLAYKIERKDCSLDGGRQDHYSATFGGFNFMEFSKDEKVIVNPLRIKNWIICELESSLLLFSTNISRESSKIIAEQSQNVKSKKNEQLDSMHELKKEAIKFKESLLKGDFDEIVRTLRKGWESKKKSAKSVSNSYMDEIYNCAINSGALAGKVSGAGGGGFMMFYVPFNKRINLINGLKKYDGNVSNCHFTNQGCQAWYC
tara:strand:+ start:1137 stop:2165 length:1029 start_codon:yes stop_codon:yes gene_type:complete